MGSRSELTLFLCGDVMVGRGIDQLFAQASRPHLFEQYVTSALDYVALAEQSNGPVARPVSLAYPWGEALAVLERERPDARIVNLETSVTTSEHAEPKGINYRMHPANVGVLSSARIDCCVLANNHVLDWGEAGLLETLDVLERAGVRVVGAGRDSERARAPVALPVDDTHRVLVCAFATTSAGVPLTWDARADAPGVHVLPDLSDASVERVAALIARARRAGDLVVASVHWGPNWSYTVPPEHRRFAHALIDRAAVDVVHGHSSHHVMPMEVHHDRPILYGCGDFVNDYEGIHGYQRFRADLTLMYLPTFDARTGALVRLRMVPLRMRRLRLERPSRSDERWLLEMLTRECRQFELVFTRRAGAFETCWR